MIGVLERGPVVPGRVLRMAAQDAPVRSCLQAHDDGPAPRLDEPDADGSGLRHGYGNRILAGRHRAQDSPHDTHRLDQFVETEGDSREHVAVLLGAPAHGELIVGRARRIHAQIERLSAGSPGEADEPDPGCEFGQYGAGTRESIPQAGVLFVDAAQHGDFIGELNHALIQPCGAGRSEVVARAARHDQVEQVALSERLLRCAQQVLLQARELREPEGEPGIIAKRAEVAEVVGDALELQRQRTQPRRSRWHCGRRHALECLAIGPCIGHARVTGHSCREAVSVEDRQFGEASLDALVHVAQALLEPQHLLAHHGEAEVSGFDDAGVHRADGNLMDAVALDPHERVIVDRRLGRRGHRAGGQRERVRGPGRMAQPRPGVPVGRTQAAEIEHRSLHAAGRREHVLDARVLSVAVRDRNADQEYARRCDGHGMKRVALADSIRAPEREQSSTGGCNVLRQVTPLDRVDDKL